MKAKVLIVGCGDLGQRLGVQLAAQGWRVLGMRRQAQALPAVIEPVLGDVSNPRCPPLWPQGELDALVYCVAASQHDEAGYRAAYLQGLQHVLSWLAEHGQRPKQLIFTSSTGVYAQRDGQWIDEQSATEPSRYTGQVMLEAEQCALNSGLEASVVRLGGIYGPGREHFLGQVRQGAQVLNEPAVYTNRIHIDDAAGLVAHLLNRAMQGEPLQRCYLGVDNYPAPLHEVVLWLREQLQVQADPTAAFLSRAASKRCSNTLARDSGWTPLYPTYREGFQAILSAAQ